MNDKQNQNQNQSHLVHVIFFPRALRKLQVLAWNYDQLIVLFAPVLITQFRIDFSTLIWTPLHIDVLFYSQGAPGRPGKRGAEGEKGAGVS